MLGALLNVQRHRERTIALASARDYPQTWTRGDNAGARFGPLLKCEKHHGEMWHNLLQNFCLLCRECGVRIEGEYAGELPFAHKRERQAKSQAYKCRLRKIDPVETLRHMVFRSTLPYEVDPRRRRICRLE